MQSAFKNYPEIPWKSGWRITSGPDDRAPFTTGSHGAVVASGNDWILQLIDPEISCTVHLFFNGLSIKSRRHPEKKRIDLFAIKPGLLYGAANGLPPPRLMSEKDIGSSPDSEWLQSDAGLVLLRRQENRFVLICGETTIERAAAKADIAFDEDFDLFLQKEEENRKGISALFSMNPRHNPPVALAAETLTARLRERTGPLHGLWSVADGFETETFSLNELYPLIRAWNLVDASVAQELMQTAMNLQQSTGGFPSWVNARGLISTVAPWPLIAQSFELMWQNGRDPALLKKYLPALRKYAQWFIRYFDPRRDRIPAWQSEQEIFVPGSFVRGQATPELTALLINELDSVLRLCKEEGAFITAEESIAGERDQLIRTLNTVFWNPELKAFSNVWKDGHYLHSPSFGSFMPLFWNGLDKEKQTALLESFEATHGFPGTTDPASWKVEDIDDTDHRPVIHQFMAFDAIRSAGTARGLLMLFVRRAREGFAAWFEREAIGAARGQAATAAYALGPVTAALTLVVQHEFVYEAAKAPTAAQLFLRGVHRLKLRRTDLRIIIGFTIAAVLTHLLYTVPRSLNAQSRVAEAALHYQQGHFSEAFRLSRRYPDNALANLLQANILMLTERPDAAEPLYRKALSKNTASPSALFGLALALQMNGDFEQAAKRYSDFIAIHSQTHPAEAGLANEFMSLTREQFRTPPRWRRVYTLRMMNDLGL